MTISPVFCNLNASGVIIYLLQEGNRKSNTDAFRVAKSRKHSSHKNIKTAFQQTSSFKINVKFVIHLLIFIICFVHRWLFCQNYFYSVHVYTYNQINPAFIKLLVWNIIKSGKGKLFSECNIQIEYKSIENYR